MLSVAHVTFLLPESSSFISLKLSCSRFVMLIRIHQQLRLFRLIPHWNRIGLSGSLRIGNEPPLQAHCALDNSLHCPKAPASDTFRFIVSARHKTCPSRSLYKADFSVRASFCSRPSPRSSTVR